MHPMRTAGILACRTCVAALGLAMAGCGTGPSVRVTAVDLVTAGQEASEYALRLELTNPGATPIRLDEFEYSLSMPGASAYHGKWITGRTIPAHETVTESVPAVILSPSVALTTPAPWQAKGEIRYLATNRLAQMLFDAGIQRPSVGFAGGGREVGRAVSAPHAIEPSGGS